MRLNLIAVLMIALSASIGANASEREFLSGYIGTVPSAKEDQAGTYFNRAEVRRLLAALENGPVPETAAAQLFTGDPTELADLARLKLVRRDRGMLRLGFPYFTAADMQSIHAVADKYVPSLVAAYKADAAGLDAILARYPVAGVEKKRLAFVLVAGFGLNWDGLDFLALKKYRQPLLVQGQGWQYGFWASEAVPDYSYKAYYWGSSTFPADGMNLDPPLDFAFSSFGDPLSDPRMNFPDLFALPAEQMAPPVREAAEKLGFKDDDTLGLGLKGVLGLSRARSVGTILFAMRTGADTKAKICAALAAQDQAGCDGELTLLTAAGYIAASGDDRYVLRVPVLDDSDRSMLVAALVWNRKVMETWLAQNYTPIRRELLRLTAVRQGIPYPALFSQIWHELFGLATRELVSEGLIEDPYEKDVVWQGSIPVVWRHALYRHDWQ